MVYLDTTPVNKCDIGTHTCDANAICTHTGSSYTCDCSEGYSGDGYYCIKGVNECDDECDDDTTTTTTTGDVCRG